MNAFDGRFGNFNHATFSKDLILALSLVGLFLLIIACVNFINLTTAQAMNRAREVGCKESTWQQPCTTAVPVLGETGITVLLALIASLWLFSSASFRK